MNTGIEIIRCVQKPVYRSGFPMTIKYLPLLRREYPTSQLYPRQPVCPSILKIMIGTGTVFPGSSKHINHLS